MNFPSLIRVPAYPIDVTIEDAVLRSETDSGHVITRPRFTRARRSFALSYEDAPTSDMLALEDFYFNSCGNGSATFNWIRPDTGISYIVGFKEPPKISNSSHQCYNMQVTLEQR